MVHKDCEHIPNVTTDHALGQWLVDQRRLEVADYLRPHLNYESIGTQYRNEHNGVFAPNGYVGLKPGYVEQMQNDQGMGMICLTLTTSRGECLLGFPATDEQLGEAKRTLGIEELAQASISAVEFSVPQLTTLVPLDTITAEDANELALCLQQIKADGEMIKYCAVLEVEHPDTFSEAVNIAMDIDDYELVPEDMGEYGKAVLRRTGADDEVIDTIDGYMDFAQLGKDSLEEDGVRRTDFGLVRRISAPFSGQSEMSPQML